MDMFHKRPLSLILCIWLGGFSLFAFMPKDLRLIFLLAPLPLFAILATKSTRRALPIAAATTLILSLLASFLYFDMWFKAHERFDGAVKIEAVVTEMIPTDYASYNITLKSRNINSSPLSRYKLRATVSDEDIGNIRIGSVICFYGELCPFEGDESFDAESYYTSRGYSAKIKNIRDISVCGDAFVLNFSHFRENISRQSMLLAGRDAGGLFTALFTGERNYLSGNLTLNFTRTGINHVLALSGAHLVILSVIVNRLLKLCRLGKKPRILITTLLAILYVAMTGFSASVTRAGIMLAIAYSLFLLSSTQDSVTALCVSVFTICMVEPYAIYDIGLWLSAFATLGVIEAGVLTRLKRSKHIDTSESDAVKLRHAVTASILSTILATGATVLISVKTFIGISPMTLITTPLFSFLSEIYIYLGLIMLAFGEILPIGGLMRGFFTIIDGLAELFSKNGLAYFSGKFPAVRIAAILVSILLICFLVLKIKHKKIATCVVALSISSVFVIAGVMTADARAVESIIYSAEESSESFVIRSGGLSCAIDISSGSVLSHYDMLNAVTDTGLVALDATVFTRYSSNLPDKANGVMKSLYTKKIYLPRPENADEILLAQAVEAVADEYSAEVKYYNRSSKLSVGNVSITESYRMPYGEGTAMCILEIEANGQKIAYLGSGTLNESKASDTASSAVLDADTLIFGSCGKKYKSSIIFDKKYEGKHRIILASDNFYFTQDSRKFYDDCGTKFNLRPKRVELLP